MDAVTHRHTHHTHTQLLCQKYVAEGNFTASLSLASCDFEILMSCASPRVSPMQSDENRWTLFFVLVLMCRVFDAGGENIIRTAQTKWAMLPVTRIWKPSFLWLSDSSDTEFSQTKEGYFQSTACCLPTGIFASHPCSMSLFALEAQNIALTSFWNPDFKMAWVQNHHNLYTSQLYWTFSLSNCFDLKPTVVLRQLSLALILSNQMVNMQS